MRLTRESTAWKGLFTLSLVPLLLALGCKTASEDNDTTNTFVRVVSVLNSEGDGDVNSDVCIQPDGAPPPPLGCSVAEDQASISLIGSPKDQSQLDSSVNDVVFTRYRVTYTRADGRNVPGVEVPYAFDGAANFTVPIDGTVVERSIVVVRHQAKLESPLIGLSTFSGGGTLISTIAQIDLYGTDGAGRQIRLTAFITVTFGNFADAEEG